MEPETEEPEPHDPLYLPLTSLSSRTRGRQFVRALGEVLALGWLRPGTDERVRAALALLLPPLACGCVENNDLVSLQEVLLRMDVNVGNYDGDTALHRACERGKTDMVKYLLLKGATTQLSNRPGYTPLHLAIKHKHFDLIQILRLKGATVSLKPVRMGMELIRAVQTRDYQLLHAWYLAGVNLSQSDYNGQTALHAAVKKRDKNMVAKLLKYGVTPQNKDVWGNTAVDEARENNLHDILVLFYSCSV